MVSDWARLVTSSSWNVTVPPLSTVAVVAPRFLQKHPQIQFHRSIENSMRAVKTSIF